VLDIIAGLSALALAHTIRIHHSAFRPVVSIKSRNIYSKHFYSIGAAVRLVTVVVAASADSSIGTSLREAVVAMTMVDR
jgi:hypothetical protein